MKKKIIWAVSVVVAIMLLTITVLAIHEHVYDYWLEVTAPTCIAPGLEETYCLDLNCNQRLVRTVPPLDYHSYTLATCTEPGACVWCGDVKEAPTGHTFTAATCQNYKHCVICNFTLYEEGLGTHDYYGNFCTGPITCSVCKRTVNNIGDHEYAPATCQQPATCTECGETMGSVIDHIYELDGRCIMCGRREVAINGVEDGVVNNE